MCLCAFYIVLSNSITDFSLLQNNFSEVPEWKRREVMNVFLKQLEAPRPGERTCEQNATSASPEYRPGGLRLGSAPHALEERQAGVSRGSVLSPP